MKLNRLNCRRKTAFIYMARMQKIKGAFWVKTREKRTAEHKQSRNCTNPTGSYNFLLLKKEKHMFFGIEHVKNVFSLKFCLIK